MNIRDQLLDAAARLYGEVGYRGATTRRIAFEAGVNEITLFRHFGSKDALIREAVERVAHSSAAHALPESPNDAVAEITAWGRAHLDDLRARRQLIRTCMGEFAENRGIIPPEGTPTARAAKELCRYLRRLRDAGIATAEFDEGAASTMLMGVLFADAMGRDVMPDMFDNHPEEALAEYVRLFLRGIGVAHPDPVESE